jgi:hypothetical protein
MQPRFIGMSADGLEANLAMHHADLIVCVVQGSTIA